MLDVRPEELRTLKAILSVHLPGVDVWAFGSRAGGKPKPHSDLDLALITDRPIPLGKLAMLEDDLADSDLPFRVDLVDWSRASESFRAVIRRRHERLVA